MPNNKTHVFFGLIAVAISYLFLYLIKLIPYPSTTDIVVTALIGYIFGQICDVDCDVSVINKIYNTCAGLFAAYTVFFDVSQNMKYAGGAAVLTIVALEWIKHRGFMHTISFLIFITIPLWISYWPYGLFALAAGLTHLALDGELKFWR